jgi:uncharacterized OB-fold protein
MMLAVAVFDVTPALLSVNWNLAVPLKFLSGVNTTVILGNPVTVPPVTVPTRVAEVGPPIAPLARLIVTVLFILVELVCENAIGWTATVAVAVFEGPAALESVNWKLADPENPGVGVKVTVVLGNPLTVPPEGVPTRAADVGFPPVEPTVRSILTAVSADVVAVSFAATGGGGSTVMLAVAVFEVPPALESVNGKLADPENPVVGVKVTVVLGNPVTVPLTGVPTRAADVGLPVEPTVRSMVTGMFAGVVAVSFAATGGSAVVVQTPGTLDAATGRPEFMDPS